jgi:hypothetical protein
MLYRVNFLIGQPNDPKDLDSLYIQAESRDAAINQSQEFAEKVFPNMEIQMESVSTLPDGTVITCVNSMEFIPKSAELEEPLVFLKQSSLIS